jgi:hypothetical protein
MSLALTGKYISASYQRVVQHLSSSLYDGTGSLITSFTIQDIVFGSEVNTQSFSVFSSSIALSNHFQNTDIGTTSPTFYINSGSQGLLFNTSASVLEIKNQANDDFRDIRVRNLYVMGTETILNTETLEISDNQIVLNAGYSASFAIDDAGIYVNRGTSEASASLLWNETLEVWQAGLLGAEQTLIIESTFNSLTQSFVNLSNSYESEAVKLVGNQTVGGIKTFQEFSITPSTVPSSEYQVANKLYVDSRTSPRPINGMYMKNTNMDTTGYRVMFNTQSLNINYAVTNAEFSFTSHTLLNVDTPTTDKVLLIKSASETISQRPKSNDEGNGRLMIELVYSASVDQLRVWFGDDNGVAPTSQGVVYRVDNYFQKYAGQNVMISFAYNGLSGSGSVFLNGMPQTASSQIYGAGLSQLKLNFVKLGTDSDADFQANAYIFSDYMFNYAQTQSEVLNFFNKGMISEVDMWGNTANVNSGNFVKGARYRSLGNYGSAYSAVFGGTMNIGEEKTALTVGTISNSFRKLGCIYALEGGKIQTRGGLWLDKSANKIDFFVNQVHAEPQTRQGIDNVLRFQIGGSTSAYLSELFNLSGSPVFPSDQPWFISKYYIRKTGGNPTGSIALGYDSLNTSSVDYNINIFNDTIAFDNLFGTSNTPNNDLYITTSGSGLFTIDLHYDVF